MIVALSVDRDIDLRLFSAFLAQNGVYHRISEEGDHQVVRVHTEQAAAQVRTLYERLANGEISFEAQPGETPRPRPVRHVPILQQLRRAPLTVALLIINVAFFPVTSGVENGQFSSLFHAMTFVPFEVGQDYIRFFGLGAVLGNGEYWRLLSPMFLHFGAMHIVFNLLWVWEVGKRIEMVNGAIVLLLVTLVSSLSSNFLQYFMSGPSLFGGMSGVVFGYLGYAFVWSRLVPQRDMGLPKGVYIFMIVMLVLGFAGIFDFLMPGKLANAAHLGGLIAGLTLGLIFALLKKPTTAPD